MLTIDDAISDLYRITVTEGKTTATNRLSVLADLCVQELEARNIAGALKEVVVPGIGRDKKWDVAWSHLGKVRLGISLKSLLANQGGSVPNRTDDLMGEMANVQLHSPEIVTGYIMVFHSQDKPRRDGTPWIDVFRENIRHLSGRKAPAWATGMVEASAIVEVDFSQGPTIIAGTDLTEFFDSLAQRIQERNPTA